MGDAEVCGGLSAAHTEQEEQRNSVHLIISEWGEGVMWTVYLVYMGWTGGYMGVCRVWGVGKGGIRGNWELGWIYRDLS